MEIFTAASVWVALAIALVYATLHWLGPRIRAVMLQTGAGAPLLFTVAMALHFLMTDDVFEKHFPQRSTRWGRIPLVGGPLFGWVAVALFGPTSTLLLSVVTAFLGGAILLNVFSWELTPRPDSSFALVLGRARPLCSARHRPHDFSKVEAA